MRFTKIRTCSYAMSAMLIFASGVLANTNVLVNSGFETGTLDPWYVQGGAPLITTEEAHTGAYSVRAFGFDNIRQDFAPIPTDNIVAVSYWVKRANLPFNMYTFHYADGTSTSATMESGVVDRWVLIDVTANLDIGKNLTGFSIFGTSAAPAFLDDFTILVPEPSMIALFQFAVTAMLLRRSRPRVF